MTTDMVIQGLIALSMFWMSMTLTSIIDQIKDLKEDQKKLYRMFLDYIVKNGYIKSDK